MQLEAKEPADRGLAAGGAAGEDAMLRDARGMADGQRGRVEEADPGAGAQLGVQVGSQRHQDRGQERDKARVAD